MLQALREAGLHGEAVTILSLCTEKANMHTRHEQEFVRLLSQLSAEEIKQTHVSVLLM